MSVFIISVFIIISGSWLTYKVIQQQDFEREQEKYKWVNYIFASIGMGWVVPTAFNLFTLLNGVCLVSTPHLVLGLFMVMGSLLIYRSCSYQGKYFCIKVYKLYNKLTN